MNMISAFPVVLLGVVVVWFIWPMVVDPIRRLREIRLGAESERRSEDLFRKLAKHDGPSGPLSRAQRG